MNDQTETDVMETEVEGETPNERWRRLANQRMQSAVKRLRMLQSLNGPAYDYSREQLDALVKVLYSEVVAVENELRRKFRETQPMPTL